MFARADELASCESKRRRKLGFILCDCTKKFIKINSIKGVSAGGMPIDYLHRKGKMKDFYGIDNNYDVGWFLAAEAF